MVEEQAKVIGFVCTNQSKGSQGERKGQYG